VDDAERQPTSYVFEGFRLDVQRRTLAAPDGRPVPLAPKTLDTLCHLVARAGHVVGKRELLEAIWPHVVVEENNLNQAISQLRRALGERPDEHRFIVTEPGRGYRFVARVETDAAVLGPQRAAGPEADEPTPAPTVARPSPTRSWLGAAALGISAAIAVAGLAWYFAGRDAPLRNSVAVLPFENLSPDPDNAFFAAGLHAEILSQLSKISALNVIGQTSMLGFAESARTPREISAELDVETVLHATVEYANGRVRIRPQLIAGDTGRTLWAESYDRGFEDIFAIQSEIAAEVANALRAEFSVAEQNAIDTPPTKSPAAYTAYLRARNVGNPADDLALEYLDEATRLDPDFALAHAATAQGLANRLNATLGQEAADPSEWQELELRVRAAANEALRLDPEIWLAHTALGNLHERRWRWTEALAEYERAARTAPRGVRRVPEFEPFFRNMDFTANIREQREIAALNPRVAGEQWVLGLYHAYERDAVSAALAFQRAVSLAPDGLVFHVWLAHAEGMQGRRDEALRELRRAEQLPVAYGSSISIANLAYAYAQNGSAEDARRVFSMLANRAADRRHQAGNWALAYLAVGDVAEARSALETVIEKIANQEPDAGYLSLRLIRANIYADPVLDEPTFATLRAQLRGR
jgi:TolB-like protein/DNA-binding winged helix-turn-helix (wHTH) protein/Tfp pilus assembly protein PilF